MKNPLFVVISLLLVCAGMPNMTVSAQHGCTLTPLIDISPARDGGLNYDWRFAPLQSARTFMQLRGDVKLIVQKFNVKSDYVMTSTDTLLFDRQGRILSVRSPKSNPYSPKVKFPITTLKYRYEDNRCVGSLSEEWSENANSTRPLLTRITKRYEYDVKERLWKEWEKVYFERPDGKIEEALEGFTKDPQTVLNYGADGKLKTADVLWGGSPRIYTYNQQDKVARIETKGNTEARPITYSYNQLGLLSGIRRSCIDGMDEPEYYDEEVTLTYNQQGDVSKVTSTHWLCNERWVRLRRTMAYTMTFTYTYDSQGNWTRADVKEQERGRLVSRGSITRQITYF